MRKLLTTCGLAAVLCVGVAFAVQAQDLNKDTFRDHIPNERGIIVYISRCTIVSEQLGTEWVCPDGAAYVTEDKSRPPAYQRIRRAGDGESSCTFHAPQKAWLCPNNVMYQVVPGN